MIPTFRNEIEASIYAEKMKPLQTALDTPVSEMYARRYGKRAANAAENCRLTAKAGAMASCTIHARSLSAILFHDRPDLFETRERRSAA
jgi:hypothetical protein